MIQDYFFCKGTNWSIPYIGYYADFIYTHKYLLFISIFLIVIDLGKGKDEEDYNLIKNYFSFNVNIAYLGRFGQEKSTGVNNILQEYKSKESSTGSSQTKHLTFYQQTNYRIKIFDIPGFEKEEHFQKAIEKFRLFGEKISKIKDNLYIILYFINFIETRTFQE